MTGNGGEEGEARIIPVVAADGIGQWGGWRGMGLPRDEVGVCGTRAGREAVPSAWPIPLSIPFWPCTRGAGFLGQGRIAVCVLISNTGLKPFVDKGKTAI